MVLTKHETNHLEGMKRQHFPYILRTECPKCGTKKEIDFSIDYISHPCFGKTNEVDFYCFECSHEWIIKMIPRLTLEIVGVDLSLKIKGETIEPLVIGCPSGDIEWKEKK